MLDVLDRRVKLTSSQSVVQARTENAVKVAIAGIWNVEMTASSLMPEVFSEATSWAFLLATSIVFHTE